MTPTPTGTDAVLNLMERSAKQFSTYVALIASALAAVWMGWSKEDQAAFTALHPLLVGYAPYITALAYLAVKWVPQDIQTSADKLAMREKLIKRLDNALRPAVQPAEPSGPVNAAAVLAAAKRTFPGMSEADVLASIGAFLEKLESTPP